MKRRTFRAIEIGNAFRDRLAQVEDDSEREHTMACFKNLHTWEWFSMIRANNPLMPCPGLLWIVHP